MALGGGSASVSQPGSLATPQVIEGLNEGKVLASEIGATVTGIDAANFRQYLLELAHAVAAGQLLPAKYAVGMKASGIPVGDGTPLLLAEVLWVVWIEVQGGGNAAAAQTLIADLAKELLKEHLVTKDVLMMNMDGAFLEEVGAVTKAENLRKKEIQLNTRMHYTQRRFNLLREESEGFAKLITALCASTKSTPVDQLVMEVKALIGFFDLDPNRVYDVILDAFEAAPGNAALLHLAPLFSPEARTQILGFHFQRLSAAKSAAPEALFNIAAQLIKAKLVPLEGLLPHLAPPDKEAQAAVQEARKKLAEAVDKIGVVSLTQAAAEKDEASRSKVGLTAGKMELDARLYITDILAPALAANHKLGLAAGLLQVDDWESASKLLNLLDSQKLDPMAFPPIARALCGLVRKRLEPSCKALYPDGPRDLCILNRKNGGADVEISPMDDDTVGLLLRLGVHAHVDVTLLSQLARLLKHMLVRTSLLLSSPPTIAEGNRRIALVNLLLPEVLLPALCMVPANVGLVNDIWGVLDLIGTTQRWLIYNRLKAKEKDDPLLRAAGKLAITEVRKVMRRVHAPDSKDKKERKRLLAPFARLLAKAAHANPLPVCALIVSHVEAYPVMTEPILDAMRYLTPYGYDVLSFTLVHQLGASGRDKLKADGLNISDWLQGLSGFVGQACRRYDKMDTSAICQYIANTLKAAQSYDLLVLKALLSDMTGIMLVSDLSSEQVEALAGGPLLQQEVINLGAQQASAKAISRTSNRLVAALRNDKLTMPLFIMLAQQRRFIATSTDSPHLKLIAELYDKCQETLYLYTEFVSNALPPTEWAALLPPVSELVTQYGVDFEVAFHGHRSLLKDLAPPAVALLDLMPIEYGDAAMEEVEDGELEEEKLPVGHALPNGVGNSHEPGETILAMAAGPGPATEKWLRIVEDIQGTLPEDVWKVMSPEFYLTFWSLSYGDIFVPSDRYEREIQRLTDLQTMKKAEERSKKQLLEQARDPRYMYRNDAQVDVTEIEDDLNGLKEQLDRLKDLLRSMPEEQKAQEANAARVERFLAAARPHWRCERKGMLQAYLQQCILPRVTYSPTDAAFCAKFTQRLHELAVPFFPTILYLDTMMKQLINLVFSCTDREALNLAIFLNETFILLERWRGSEAVYARECFPVPGFSTSFTDPDAKRTDFSDYRSLCARWQNNVTIGLRAALQSKNYVQIRNALLILNTTQKVFPATHHSARVIKAAVLGVRDTDSSEDDLKTMANMYSVALENEIRKPGRMLTKDEYEGTGEPPKKLEVAQNGGSRPPTTKPGTGSSKALVKGSSSGREEATSSAGKEAAKGSTASGKPSSGEAGAATDGQRRKELRAEAQEFRPGGSENTGAAAKLAGDAKPPRSGARSGADAKSGADARSAADAKTGTDAKSARGGSVGGKSEPKGREGRGDAKTGADGKRPSDTGRRRDADKADVAKGAEDKSQRPPKRPRTDTAEAAEPAAPPAARQRVNPPVREKPPQAAAAAERTASLSRQPSSAAPRGGDRAAAERKPDDSASRQADRDKDDAAGRSRSGPVADGRSAGADAAKRSARGDAAAPAGEARRRAIPVPGAVAAAASEMPEPGEVVDAAAAAPAARKRAADRDNDKPPGEAARGRAGATKKAPDQAATEKKEAAKPGAAEHAEKAREQRESSRAGRARNAEQKSDKPEKATADGKGSGRSSRDGGASKEKADQAAAPVRKDVEQEKPKKAAAEEERGPLPGRLQREHSGSEKRSPAARNAAGAWLETARKENQRGVMSRLGLPTAAAAAGASTPASPTGRRMGIEVHEAAVVEEADDDGAEGGDDDGDEGDKKSEGKRKKKKKEKSKEKKRHRDKGEDPGEEGADEEKSKKDKKKHKKH